MAQPRHSDTQYDRGPSPDDIAADGYSAGGQIAEMQASIARRLAGDRIDPERVVPEAPTERVVRIASRTAGYASLLCGYGLVVLAFIYWL